MPHKEYLIGWLAAAYGMESALVTRLGNQLSDVTDQPDVEEKLLDHLNRTSGHANMVQTCLARLGGATSSLDQGGLPLLMETLQSSRHAAADETLIKALVGDMAAECYEIATYKALIALAGALGDQEVADTCRTILREEEEMARWLNERLPGAVKDIMRMEAASSADGQS